jgi:hypothetical protein
MALAPRRVAPLRVAVPRPERSSVALSRWLRMAQPGAIVEALKTTMAH